MNPSHVTGHGSRCGGFTLLELLIVLFLSTLVMGLSAVFFANTLPSTRLNAAARDISATVRYARALAQIKGESQVVVIDLDSRNYGIRGRGAKSIPPDVNIRVTDPFSGDMDKGLYNIMAYNTGAVNGCTIVLWNDKKTVNIQTDPVVGAVVIK
jgi:prepilin-type N-terminal cleavage/methylation domain-containing protein